jgi:hypothetical protein
MARFLDRRQRRRVLNAILRARGDAPGDRPERPEPRYPGEVHRLDQHLAPLVDAVRGVPGDVVESCLGRRRADLCTACPYDYPGCYCPLRTGGCVLRRRAGPILRALAEVANGPGFEGDVKDVNERE